MSVSEKIDLARSKVNARAFDKFTDDKRREFLDRLHVAAQPIKGKLATGLTVFSPPRVKLTDWEKHFVADHVSEPRPFTDAIRNCIDELRREHEHRLSAIASAKEDRP